MSKRLADRIARLERLLTANVAPAPAMFTPWFLKLMEPVRAGKGQAAGTAPAETAPVETGGQEPGASA
jgi:hypothetical protein